MFTTNQIQNSIVSALTASNKSLHKVRATYAVLALQSEGKISAKVIKAIADKSGISSKSYADDGRNLLKALDNVSLTPVIDDKMTMVQAIDLFQEHVIIMAASAKGSSVSIGAYLKEKADPEAFKASVKAKAEKKAKAEAEADKEAARVAKLEKTQAKKVALADLTNAKLIKNINALLTEAANRNLDLSDTTGNSQAYDGAYKVLVDTMKAMSNTETRDIRAAA